MLILTSTEISHLRLVQKTNKNKRDYIKASVILMLSFGDSAEQISERLGISVSSVYHYQRIFSEVPFDEFFKDNYVPFSGKLDDNQQSQLKVELSNYLYTTTAEVKEYIKHSFDIEMANGSISKMLKRLGFSYKKTQLVPGKLDTEKQALWITEFRKKLLQMAENVVLVFLDAVHPMHNTKSEYGWIPIGEVAQMKSNPGRNRLNINGAINPLNPSEVYIHMTDRVTYESNICLLQSIKDANPGKHIWAIADNARYNHANALKDWLSDNKDVTLEYLPPYSPNLNPIERLWKFMRKKAINSYYYQSFDEFKKAIIAFFENINIYANDLASLINLNFQTF
jgi:transposase